MDTQDYTTEHRKGQHLLASLGQVLIGCDGVGRRDQSVLGIFLNEILCIGKLRP